MHDIAFLGFICIIFYIFNTWTRSILASYCQNCSIPHGHPSDHFRLGVGLGASAHWGLCSHGFITLIVFWITFHKWFFPSHTYSSGRRGMPVVLLRSLFVWEMMSRQLLFGTYYPLTWRHIPEEQNRQLRRRKNLITRTIFSFFGFPCARGLTLA